MNVRTTFATMLPVHAVGLGLEHYDKYNKEGKPYKIFQDTTVDVITVNDLPKNFAKGKIIDVRLGELISLGVVGAYYNDADSHLRKRYKVVVGIEDISKFSLREAEVSDGAIYEPHDGARMPFQQVLVQGYFPKNKAVATVDVVSAIKSKIKDRPNLPKHCGLIISIYSEGADIDLKEVMDKTSLDDFAITFCIVYRLPELDRCRIYRLDNKFSPEVFTANSKVVILKRASTSYEKSLKNVIREVPANKKSISPSRG